MTAERCERHATTPLEVAICDVKEWNKCKRTFEKARVRNDENVGCDVYVVGVQEVDIERARAPGRDVHAAFIALNGLREIQQGEQVLRGPVDTCRGVEK